MADEIFSFVNKFNNMKYAGKKAFLWLECQDGQSFVTLQAHLPGCHDDPHRHNCQDDLRHRCPRHAVPRSRRHGQEAQEDPHHKKATPSRIRRRIRRAEACTEARIAADMAASKSEAVLIFTTPPSPPVIAETAVADEATKAVAIAAVTGLVPTPDAPNTLALPPLLSPEQIGEHLHPPAAALISEEPCAAPEAEQADVYIARPKPSFPPSSAAVTAAEKVAPAPPQVTRHQHPPPARYSAEPILSSFSFKVSEDMLTNFPPTSSSKGRVRKRTAFKSKPSDPLPMTVRMKPAKFLKTPQTLNIEKAIWNSGGGGGRAHWVGDTCFFIRFVNGDEGLYKEPRVS